MKRATILKVDEKTHRVMLGGHEIGVSKSDTDARFHMHAINDALDVAYLEGQKYLERMVEERRIESELMQAKLEARAELEQFRNGLCCLKAHAIAKAPWTCDCDCHKAGS